MGDDLQLEKTDVLNLEWCSFPSRDRNMATLVSNYLRFMAVEVKEKQIFNGYSAICNLNPQILFMTNTIGDRINFEISRYASKKGISVISLISEGNFKYDQAFAEEEIWGWNKDKVLYETLHLQWSEKSRDFTVQNYPQLSGKVLVSGGVGFDMYKIMPSVEKKRFLTEFGKSSYQKVVGICCYPFDCFSIESPYFDTYMKLFSQDQVSRCLNDFHDFCNILNKVIASNPDYLFLVKLHPASIRSVTGSGMEIGKNALNVLHIQSEKGITDCISVSDCWIFYDSTTALEAWLMGKQTLMLNPSGSEFLRDSIYQGSPVFRERVSLEKAMQSAIHGDVITEFEDLASIRKRIIREIIQWDDGLNHVRAGNEILNILKTDKYHNIPGKDSLSDLCRMWRQKTGFSLSPFLKFLPKFSQYHKLRNLFDQKQLFSYQKTMMQAQLAFYHRLGLERDSLSKIRCI